MPEFEFREVRKAVQFWLIPDGINGLLCAITAVTIRERKTIELRMVNAASVRSGRRQERR